MLLENWYLLGEKNISSHAHKTGSWYLLGLGVLFKISDEQNFCPVDMGDPRKN